jgi:hypothetical protein
MLVAIIGSTTFYVYHSLQIDNSLLAKAVEETRSINPSVSNPLPLDATNNWTEYNNSEGGFSLKYPPNWAHPIVTRACSSSLFYSAIYLGPDAKSVLKCGTNYQGQVYVASYLGDQRSNYALSDNYKDIKVESVTVNGVSGSLTRGTLINQNNLKSIEPNNTFTERYILFNGTNTIVAQYIQAPLGYNPSKNVLKDFEIIVTRTLQIT